MFKKYLYLSVSVVIAILVLKESLILRYFNYETRPVPNLDEFNYVWQAISLKKTGLPMAWSLNEGEYKSPKYSQLTGGIKGFSIDSVGLDKFQQENKSMSAVKEFDYGKGMEQVLFVSPFFDHPPLGGLVYNLGMPNNIEEVEQVKPSDFRKSAIILAVITSILLYVLLLLIFKNPWVSLLSVIIYSTVPTYILATRTAYLENVVSPFVLAHLILLFLYTKYNSKKYSITILIISGVLGGLSVLAKEPAIGFLVGSTILLWMNKVSIKNILIFLLACSLPVVIYVGWGLWLYKDLFLGIFLTNASRSFFGAIKIITQLEALKFKNFPIDGWWIWGFISFLIISLKLKKKKYLYITVPLLTHMLTILFMPSPNYPWYWLSSIPLLAACSSILIWQIVKKPNWANGMAFFLIPFSSSYYWGREAIGLSPSISHYRYIFLVFVLFIFMRIKLGRFKLVRFVWFLFFVGLIYRIFIYNEVFFPYLMAHWGNLSVPSLPNY